MALVKSYRADVFRVSWTFALHSNARNFCSVICYGGQFMLSTQLIILYYPAILSHRQHHSFFRNLPPLSVRSFNILLPQALKLVYSSSLPQGKNCVQMPSTFTSELFAHKSELCTLNTLVFCWKDLTLHTQIPTCPCNLPGWERGGGIFKLWT